MPNMSSRTRKKLLRDLAVKVESDIGTQLGSYWRHHGASDYQLRQLDEYVRSFGNGPFDPDPWKVVVAITGNAEADTDTVEAFWGGGAATLTHRSASSRRSSRRRLTKTA